MGDITLTNTACAPEPGYSPIRSFWLRFSRNRLAIAGLVFLVVIHFLAAAAPLVTAYAPEKIDPINSLAPPSLKHPLGTDEFGRDVWSRVIYGSRISLMVGLLSVGISVVIGTLLGSVSGYFGGLADDVIMRCTDAMMSMPTFFLLLAILAIFGGDALSVILVIGLTSWMSSARIVRSEFLRYRHETFVSAARAVGAGDGRILLRHVLPQAIPSIIVSATLGVAFAILVESAISFLGLGIQPPTPTWGNMLMSAQMYIWTAPRMAIYPGMMILLTVLSYNVFGDGLRDALDPRLKR